MNWIALAQDMGQWRAFVNTIINLQVLFNIAKFFSICETGASQAGLSPVKLVIITNNVTRKHQKSLGKWNSAFMQKKRKREFPSNFDKEFGREAEHRG
jgi:hypothetical protein